MERELRARLDAALRYDHVAAYPLEVQRDLAKRRRLAADIATTIECERELTASLTGVTSIRERNRAHAYELFAQLEAIHVPCPALELDNAFASWALVFDHLPSCTLFGVMTRVCSRFRRFIVADYRPRQILCSHAETRVCAFNVIRAVRAIGSRPIEKIGLLSFSVKYCVPDQETISTRGEMFVEIVKALRQAPADKLQCARVVEVPGCFRHFCRLQLHRLFLAPGAATSTLTCQRSCNWGAPTPVYGDYLIDNSTLKRLTVSGCCLPLGHQNREIVLSALTTVTISASNLFNCSAQIGTDVVNSLNPFRTVRRVTIRLRTKKSIVRVSPVWFEQLFVLPRLEAVTLNLLAFDATEKPANYGLIDALMLRYALVPVVERTRGGIRSYRRCEDTLARLLDHRLFARLSVRQKEDLLGLRRGSAPTTDQMTLGARLIGETRRRLDPPA